MRWVLVGGGLFVLFAVTMAGSDGVRSTYDFVAYHRQTTGTVLSGPDPKNHLYSSYSYTVNGKTYRSVGLAPDGVTVGGNVIVTYALNDPEDSKIGTMSGLRARTFEIGLLMLCLLSSAIVTALLKNYWDTRTPD